MRGEGVAIWGPRRVRYEGFPTPEQLARLEQFATAEQMKALQAQPGARPGGRRPEGCGPRWRSVQCPGRGAAAPAPRGAGLGVQDKE